MSLNIYRDEARDFLEAIEASGEPVEKKISMLEHELYILRNSLNDEKAAAHQVYDLLFLIFEITSQYNIDLDSQWLEGRLRKTQK